MITLEPIGHVRSGRRELADDDWDSVPARIELSPDLPLESLDGIEEFSHAEIVYHFDRVPESSIERGARVLTVRGLDAVDGTPVLDIKPVMAEFLPRGGLRQPRWSVELMREYWASA